MYRSLLILLLLFSNPVTAQQRSDDKLLCAAVYLIVNSIIEDPGASDMIAKIQESFESLYAGTRRGTVTNGDLSKAKHEHAIYLGNLYDRDPDQAVHIEMNCDAWREALVPHWQNLYEKMKELPNNNASKKKLRKLMNSFPKMPNKRYKYSHPRWEQSKYMVVMSFETWTENGRKTPYSIKQQLFDSLNQSSN